VIQGYFPDGICRNATFRALVKDKLFWVGPHYRFSPNAGYSNDRTDAWAKIVAASLVDQCGMAPEHHIVGPIKLTAMLLQLQEKRDLTYDIAHWGREVNLLKAQEMYRELVALRLGRGHPGRT
jgi:hypothetical protein